MNKFKQFLIAFDQVINVIVGSGWADETLSCYYYRTNKITNIRIVDFIFGKDHCLNAYLAELNRQQFPPDSREV